MLNTFKKNKWLIIIWMIPCIICLFYLCDRTNTVVTLTGDITPIERSIIIESDYEQKGSINSVFVINFEYATRFQNLLLKNGDTINVARDMGAGETRFSGEDYSKMSKIQKDQSEEASLILAYNEARKSDPTVSLSYTFKGLIIHWYNEKAIEFNIGDILVGINDIYAENNKELFLNYVFTNRKIDDVFHVERNNKVIDIPITRDELGISIYEKYTLDPEHSNPKFSIKSDGTGGPSGGLLQTIAIFNKLVPYDYTHGLTICGTGTIAINGKVGEIGGIKQKIFTAKYNKVDIFFCPSGDYAEAQEAYELAFNAKNGKMKLIEVKTFHDAIQYLESLA